MAKYKKIKIKPIRWKKGWKKNTKPKPKFRRVWIAKEWKWGWKKIFDPLDWLTGNVVPVDQVPAGRVREFYEDTIHRAAKAAQAYGKPIHVNSSYRDPAYQARLYKRNMDPATGRPRPGRPLTARPGTSPHERGIGLDIPNARITPKLIKELRKRKLMDDVPSEIWHLTNHAALKKGA